MLVLTSIRSNLSPSTSPSSSTSTPSKLPVSAMKLLCKELIHVVLHILLGVSFLVLSSSWWSCVLLWRVASVFIEIIGLLPRTSTLILLTLLPRFREPLLLPIILIGSLLTLPLPSELILLIECIALIIVIGLLLELIVVFSVVGLVEILSTRSLVLLLAALITIVASWLWSVLVELLVLWLLLLPSIVRVGLAGLVRLEWLAALRWLGAIELLGLAKLLGWPVWPPLKHLLQLQIHLI